MGYLGSHWVSGEQSPVDVTPVPQVWVVTILGSKTQHLLHQLLGVCWSLQEQLNNGCQQLQLNLQIFTEITNLSDYPI